MVHALESIHRLLAPGGRLIDIHPFAEAPVVEIHQGGRITFSEPLPAYAVEDIEHSKRALAEVIGRGLFAVERADMFDFRTYAASVAELVAYLTEQGSLGDGGPEGEGAAETEELAAHVEQLMEAAGVGAEVVLHEKVHITLLRPVPMSRTATASQIRS